MRGGACVRAGAGLMAAVMGLAGCSGDDPDATRETVYACEQDVGITVAFNPVSRIATVIGLGPAALLLPERKVASGFRYATDRVELRGKGAEASLTVDGATVACRASDLEVR